MKTISVSYNKFFKPLPDRAGRLTGNLKILRLR